MAIAHLTWKIKPVIQRSHFHLLAFERWRMKSHPPAHRTSSIMSQGCSSDLAFGVNPFWPMLQVLDSLSITTVGESSTSYIYIYMYHIQHGHRSKRAKLLSKIADFYSPLFKQSPHQQVSRSPRLLWRARRYGVGCVLGSSCEIVVSSVVEKPQAATESLMCHGCPILPRCCSGIPWYIHEMAIE